MADIKITRSELADPAIDEVINLEKSLARSSGAFVEDIPTPFYLNPIFYYSLAALVAGIAAWACQEPFMNEGDKSERNEIPFITNFMYFGIVAGFLGLAVGLAHGIANRNLKKALYCAAVGLGVGLGASLVTSFVAGLLFGITTLTAVQIAGPDSIQLGVQFRPHGLPFFVLTCGRGLAWSIAAMGGGLSLGVALKSRKLRSTSGISPFPLPMRGDESTLNQPQIIAYTLGRGTVHNGDESSERLRRLRHRMEPLPLAGPRFVGGAALIGTTNSGGKKRV